MIYAVLNILGLLLDIVGAVGLYFTRIKSLESIPNPLRSIRIKASNIGVDINSGKELVNELTEQLNQAIDKTDRKNAAIHHKSKWWFYLILVGFSLQFISAIMQIMADPS